VIDDIYGGTTCINGNREAIEPYISDKYVRLRNIDRCDISIIGIAESAEYIEITSDTVPCEQRKGYNTLMRAVAVIVAFVCGKPILSVIDNKWSAYSLLKDYQTTIVWKGGGEVILSGPLSREDAKNAMKDCKLVFIRPTIINLNFATRIFARASIQCGSMTQ
jgi:hypothetical protein